MTAYLILSLVMRSLSAWVCFTTVPDTPGGLRASYILLFFIYCFMAAGSFVFLINIWEVQP